MDLFLLEHKKLWSKTSTKICVALCFFIIVIFSNILSFCWWNFGSHSSSATTIFNNHFDGYKVIRERQKYADTFGGELTDESLQEMVKDYQELEAAGREYEVHLTDGHILNNYLLQLFPEYRDPDVYRGYMMGYVDPDVLTGFYERREIVLEKFLENNNQPGAEREYLMAMNSKVEIPFKYKWVEGWAILLGDVIDPIGNMLGLFLVIILSSLFAGEWRTNMNTLLLTTKNGWQKIAFTKILVGIVFTLELFMMNFVGSILSQLIFLGTDGWDLPIQLIKLYAIAPVNMLQAEVFEWATVFLGVIGFACIVMFISANSNSTVLAMIISFAVLFAPRNIETFLPLALQKALDLFPLAGQGKDVFRTNTFHIFGKYFWSPYFLLPIPILVGVLFLPFAVKAWAHQEKA